MYIFGCSITYNSVLNKTWLPADFNDALFVFLHVLHELCYMYLVTNLKKQMFVNILEFHLSNTKLMSFDPVILRSDKIVWFSN